MERKYTGGLASYAIWLPEFTTYISLYQSGKTAKEIMELSDEENIFKMPTKPQAKRCSRDMVRRVDALPESIVDMYPMLDSANQKLVAILSSMLVNRLLDELVYEVYRPKAAMREQYLYAYEVEEFMNQKTLESQTVANWSHYTRKRVIGALKQHMRDASLMTIDGQKRDKLLYPLMDLQLGQAMKDAQLNYELLALGGR